MQTEPDEDHAEHRDQGGDDHGDARPDDAVPRNVRCPMLACGRLHELPPDW
ncbi:hypothetical protein [Streptomyces albidoflavus]|uniref:hypothetical protein n=1 Tax=Streptomyces albidoflavus TaxID=1886 RepID=UPI0013EEDC66|nr:hypothetical protein [Streptomyces albidoflavus]